MNICSCGNLFGDQYSQCPRCDALQVFGLGKDATETEIRNAYRILVKVWQPDRIQDDPKLKEEAGNKLKDINTAFESLIATSTELFGRQRPVYITSRATSSETVPDSATSPRKPSQGYTTLVVLPERTPPPPPSFWQRNKPRFAFWRKFILLFVIAVIACIAYLLMTGKSVRTFLSVYSPGNEQVASVSDSPSVSAPAASSETAQPAPRNADNRLPAKTHAEAHAGTQQAAAAPRPKSLPFVTVGSTRDEVLAQQGPPTAASEDKLVYGKSELYLKDDAVVGWRVDPFASPIRVKMWPQGSVDPELDFFSYGSSKDAVIVVQGTPTAFTENKFEYGGSVVYFQNNRVVSWRNDPASIPLKAR